MSTKYVVTLRCALQVVTPSAVWVSPGVSDQRGPEAAGGWWRVQMVYGGGREDGDLSA